MHGYLHINYRCSGLEGLDVWASLHRMFIHRHQVQRNNYLSSAWISGNKLIQTHQIIYLYKMKIWMENELTGRYGDMVCSKAYSMDGDCGFEEVGVEAGCCNSSFLYLSPHTNLQQNPPPTIKSITSPPSFRYHTTSPNY